MLTAKEMFMYEPLNRVEIIQACGACIFGFRLLGWYLLFA